MPSHILDLSPLSLQQQQELIDFYEFLLAKQAKNKAGAQTQPVTANRTTLPGFAMLKSHCPAVPADFDAASLLNHDRA